MSKHIVRICTKCGRAISSESYKFCPHCGNNLQIKPQANRLKKEK